MFVLKKGKKVKMAQKRSNETIIQKNFSQNNMLVLSSHIAYSKDGQLF